MLNHICDRNKESFSFSFQKVLQILQNSLAKSNMLESCCSQSQRSTKARKNFKNYGLKSFARVVKHFTRKRFASVVACNRKHNNIANFLFYM